MNGPVLQLFIGKGETFRGVIPILLDGEEDDDITASDAEQAESIFETCGEMLNGMLES